MKNNKKSQSGKTKISVNIVVVMVGIISVFLTKYLIETERQDDIRNIGYRINNYRREVRQMKFMNAKLISELEKIKKPDVIMTMLRKYGVELSLPSLEKTATVSLPHSKVKKIDRNLIKK